MNIFKDLYNLWHDNNFFHNFFYDVRHFNDSLLSDEDRIKVSLYNSVNNLQRVLNQVNVIGYLF